MIRAEDREFVRGRGVPYDEGALSDTPEAFAALEVGELCALGAGEAQECRAVVGFAGLLLVGDLGGAIAQQPAGEGSGLAVVVANGVEVGEPVDDEQVGDAEASGELPLGLHASQEGRLAHEAPGFVVDDPALSGVGVSEGGFHPRGGAGHDHGDELVGALDGG